jgi:hypothetical protein
MIIMRLFYYEEVVMAKQEKGKMDEKAMMEIYMGLGTPGAPHKMLESLAGTWTAKSRMGMETENPMEDAGVSEQKVILGGRFLLQEYTGRMMGAPFTGIGYTGYDNQTRKYVSTWIDSTSTAILCFEGTASPDGKTVTQECTHDDPVRGPMKWRSVTRIMDANKNTFEMYGIYPGDKQEKMFEITYTRK